MMLVNANYILFHTMVSTIQMNIMMMAKILYKVNLSM